jgi:hypothetical protein
MSIEPMARADMRFDHAAGVANLAPMIFPTNGAAEEIRAVGFTP